MLPESAGLFIYSSRATTHDTSDAAAFRAARERMRAGGGGGEYQPEHLLRRAWHEDHLRGLSELEIALLGLDTRARIVKTRGSPSPPFPAVLSLSRRRSRIRSGGYEKTHASVMRARAHTHVHRRKTRMRNRSATWAGKGGVQKEGKQCK